MAKQISCLAAYGIWGEIRTKGKFKVPMKRKFVQYFLVALQNHLKSQSNVFCRYTALLDMQIMQRVTSHFIVTLKNINTFRSIQTIAHK